MEELKKEIIAYLIDSGYKKEDINEYEKSIDALISKYEPIVKCFNNIENDSNFVLDLRDNILELLEI